MARKIRGSGSPKNRGGNGRGGRGRGRGRTGPSPYKSINGVDFIVQKWPDLDGPPEEQGYSSPRGRGRGIGSPARGSATPIRGIGYSSPRGRGRGRPSINPNAPLSKILYEDRPFLRPITFVPSVYTPVLFQKGEEIFQPVVEDAGDEEQSYLPTADLVQRIFSGQISRRSDLSNDDETEALEEIDFSEIGKFQAAVDAAAAAASSGAVEQSLDAATVQEHQIKAAMVGSHPSPPHTESKTATVSTTNNLEIAVTANVGQSSTSAEALTEQLSTFFIDTTPTLPSATNRDHTLVSQAPSSTPLVSLPSPPEDEDIIVYEAPLPRSCRTTSTTVVPEVSQTSTSVSVQESTGLPMTDAVLPRPESTLITNDAHPQPIPQAPSFDSISFSVLGSSTIPKKSSKKIAPAFTAHGRTKAKVKMQRQEAFVARRCSEHRNIFGDFASRGAEVAEAQLQGATMGRDPKWAERRRGDSDLDWGDDDEADSVGDGEDEDHGMDVEDIDIDVLKSFFTRMRENGGRFVTMDDLADEQRMREEDADVRKTGSSDEDDEDGVSESGDGGQDDSDQEVEEIFGNEELALIAEVKDVEIDFKNKSDEEDEDSDELDDESQSSFQARLDRLRRNARGKHPKQADLSSDDDNELSQRWTDQDDDFLAYIEDVLDENDDILYGRDRSVKKKLFNAVRDGDFDDLKPEWTKPARRRRDKNKDLPASLQEQWERDRQKKAENKRARAQARLEAAADPFAHHKGGKKGRKAMLAAAKLDPTITVLPTRIIDMTTLVQQIRRFIANIGGPSSMSLPPTNKETRKQVHELANAFNLKSVSKGSGNARYTTLSKTTKTGIAINEKKVARIVRKSDRGGGEFVDSARKWKGQSSRALKPREGEEVGKAAPRIDQSNIGYRILASMGWSEGDSIGVSGGLEAPLKAIIKHTKLGLGATR